MKFFKKNIRIFLLTFLVLLTQCKNKYERKIIGDYSVFEYKISDSNAKVDIPTLNLLQNKTFVIKFNQKQISGKWKAGDYGDFTAIEFIVDDKHFADASLTGENFELIEMLNPKDFNCPYLDKLIYKRIEKNTAK